MMDSALIDRSVLWPADNVRVFGDVDQMREAMSQNFQGHRFWIDRSVNNFSAKVSYNRLRSLGVICTSINEASHVDAGELEQIFVVILPLSGSRELRLGQDVAIAQPGIGAVASPNERFIIDSTSRLETIAVRVAEQKLKDHLRVLTGRSVKGRIRFDLSFNMDRGNGGTLKNLTDFLLSELVNRDSLLHSPIAMRSFEDTFLTALLCGQPHNNSVRLEARTNIAAPRQVKLAEEYIRANAHEDVSISDLMRVTGVSARSLFLAFNRFRQSSPMAYLRMTRLNHAREDLLRWAPDTSVTQVALKWGFTHVGRFSMYYREQFGENPSETMHRLARTPDAYRN